MKLSFSFFASLLIILFIFQHAYPQQTITRYNTTIFDSITIDQNIVYGNNISIGSGMLEFQDLFMDVYTPVNDTAVDRPLIILIHSGNFMPKILNKVTVGAKDDSTIVELASNWAHRGFVVAAISHRSGWATFGTKEDVQKSFSEAMYRAIQDANTCVRYFKKQFVEDHNEYGIDTSKIVMGGIGSGGYAALGAAYLNTQEELMSPKLSSSLGLPFIDPFLLGGVEGKDTALFARPNIPNYSSNFDLVFSIGGAILDTNWIQAGDKPLVALHAENDSRIPYQTAAIRVPTYNGSLQEMHGGYDLVKRSINLGNQAIFQDPPFSDSLSMLAINNSSGKEGLYPFILPQPAPGEPFECELPSGQTFVRLSEHDPWNWWDEAHFIAAWDSLLPNDPLSGDLANCSEKAINPDMSAEKGRAYVDTIINYITPRIVRTFGLPTSIKEKIFLGSKINLYPNPINNLYFVLEVEGANHFIKGIEIFNPQGKLIWNKKQLHGSRVNVTLPNIPKGIYFVSIRTTEGITTKKLLIE